MDHRTITIETPFVHNGKVKLVTVHRETAGRWVWFMYDCWKATPDYLVHTIYGHIHRPTRGGRRPSAHGMEGAIDFNPQQNHFCKGCHVHDIDHEWGRIADRHDIGWGHDWRSVFDGMHFSLRNSEGGVYYTVPWTGEYPWRHDPEWTRRYGKDCPCEPEPEPVPPNHPCCPATWEEDMEPTRHFDVTRGKPAIFYLYPDKFKFVLDKDEVATVDSRVVVIAKPTACRGTAKVGNKEHSFVLGPGEAIEYRGNGPTTVTVEEGGAVVEAPYLIFHTMSTP